MTPRIGIGGLWHETNTFAPGLTELADFGAYGLAEGSSIPTVQDFVTGAAPDDSRGAVVAVFVSAVRAGQTAGPLLAGLVIATVGTSATFVAAAVIAACLLAVELLYRPEHHPVASTLGS